MHTDKVEWKELDPGIYEGMYEPILLKFSRIVSKYRVILIDVEKVLRLAGNNDFNGSINNAIRDGEWLLLPATSVLLNSGSLEYSAILDGACISYKRISINK